MNNQSHLERQAHELNEKLTLLENQDYDNILGKIMLNSTLNILVDYCGKDFINYWQRYQKLSRGKYK